MHLAIADPTQKIEPEAKPPIRESPTKTLIWISIALAILAASGSLFGLWLRTQWVGQPDPRDWFNAFYVVFARDEPLGLLVLAIFYLIAALFFYQKGRAKVFPMPKIDSRLHLALIAVVVFAIAATGATLVCHDYTLSADEYMADFQARIFLRGKITAQVPEQWVPVVHTVKPTFVEYLPATHSWKSAYLPVYAAMRAVFQSVSLESFLNPICAAVSVLALAAATRSIWPEQKNFPVIAALLLASSSQFLITAMTSYSMPAHLALNAIWLWLYSRPDRRRFYLAPVVGVLAIGLHQPIVHALFVGPFLLRIVRQRRWSVAVIFGLIYLAGCAGWFAWRLHYSGPSGSGTAYLFRLFNPAMLVIQPMDILLVIGWSSLAVPLLAALGLRQISKERPILQDAALSCLLTFGFYFFFYLDQGYGWGYRYFHATLPCFILLAVAGWKSLSQRIGTARAGKFLLASIAVSLCVQLPLRSLQAESFIRPFARAGAVIHEMKADLVGLNPYDAWYSADLIRNDPFLEKRPVVVALHRLRPEDVQILSHAGKTHFLTAPELTKMGLMTTQTPYPQRNLLKVGARH